MKKSLLNSAFLFIGLFLVSQVSAQQVTGSLDSVKKGGVTNGAIVLNIPSGVHVNSNNPRSKFAVPTSVSVSAINARAYGVTYPPGKMRKFEFSSEPISVYEGRSVIRYKVSVPKNFKGNVVIVIAKLRYQACTDEVCYAPKTQTITMRARLK